MNYVWKYKNPNPLMLNEYLAHNINKTLAAILVNRGFQYKDFVMATENFWELVDYYAQNIPGMNAAAKKLYRYLALNESQIYVFSDYDTDGITAGAIFHEFISSLSNNSNLHSYTEINIPERKDGYGLNMQWCSKIVEKKKEAPNINFLVVTFDNGISCLDEINYLHNNGIDTIITDHHEISGTIPNGIVVDPKKDDDRLGEELCGAEIAWILMYQLYKIHDQTSKKYVEKEEEKETIQKSLNNIATSLQTCLGYATVGTVGDMMPITLFNFALLYKGLSYLNILSNKDSSGPLSMLLDCFKFKDITCKDIGFNIAAAINACGQMGEANTAFEMFADEYANISPEFSQRVCKLLNESRSVTKSAKQKIRIELDNGIFDNTLFCIYVIKDIQPGIVGKLANYITEETGKPAVVLVDNDDEDNVLIGSGRCKNSSLNLLELLRPLVSKKLIKSAAGHNVACGVKFYKQTIKEVQNELNEAILRLIDKNIATITPYEDIFIDDYISVKDISERTYRLIKEIPFSMNFYAPIFCLKGIIVKAHASQSNVNNICYTIADCTDFSKTIDIWVWNKKAQEYREKNPKNIEIIGNLVRNFQNPNRFTLDVIDLKFS